MFKHHQISFHTVELTEHVLHMTEVNGIFILETDTGMVTLHCNNLLKLNSTVGDTAKVVIVREPWNGAALATTTELDVGPKDMSVRFGAIVYRLLQELGINSNKGLGRCLGVGTTHYTHMFNTLHEFISTSR